MAPQTAWFKSSYSDSNGGACIEVADLVQRGTIGTRDSKQSDGPAFESSPTAWSTFVASVVAGDFAA
ncbi:DUF397 domain-containing protein [Streptomyces sp. TX20-6-3]|uniref:DUF397 domain-containing protein n=1 Tax=Streptomyces sp. TX20-6-3 TaxID=3028705 RepID=UPI0029AAAB5A|nr:DUF397 domain-containing protein [Streptomyces sp. TX20-6-3]MDX2565110.1 DUF397 domain-containing protein [Streptomyces sp. TX20-6-3]